VVVEDHRRRNGCEQPANVRIGPGLPIQLRVLLEIRDLLARRLCEITALLDELHRRRRQLVDVDLVAEQQQAVRPGCRAFLELPGVSPERVDAEPLRMIGRRERVRRALRGTNTARTEDEPSLAFTLAHLDRRRRPPVRRRPRRHAVESNLVRVDRARLEIVDHDERVVVSQHVRRARLVPEHLDDRGTIGLDPHGRSRRADIAQERADEDAWLVGCRVHGGVAYVLGSRRAQIVARMTR